MEEKNEIVLKIEFIIVKRTDFQFFHHQGTPDHGRPCLTLLKSINSNRSTKRKIVIPTDRLFWSKPKKSKVDLFRQ